MTSFVTVFLLAVIFVCVCIWFVFYIDGLQEKLEKKCEKSRIKFEHKAAKSHQDIIQILNHIKQIDKEKEKIDEDIERIIEDKIILEKTQNKLLKI